MNRESTFLIIQNCKMYEKLNVEEVEWMSKGIRKNKVHMDAMW